MVRYRREALTLGADDSDHQLHGRSRHCCPTGYQAISIEITSNFALNAAYTNPRKRSITPTFEVTASD